MGEVKDKVFSLNVVDHHLLPFDKQVQLLSFLEREERLGREELLLVDKVFTFCIPDVRKRIFDVIYERYPELLIDLPICYSYYTSLISAKENEKIFSSFIFFGDEEDEDY